MPAESLVDMDGSFEYDRRTDGKIIANTLVSPVHQRLLSFSGQMCWFVVWTQGIILLVLAA
jgi:hypothetical protein